MNLTIMRYFNVYGPGLGLAASCAGCYTPGRSSGDSRAQLSEAH
jgi:hypothetical protein